MDAHRCSITKRSCKRGIHACTVIVLLLNASPATADSIAPCTVENYIAPSTQAELNQLRLHLDEDVSLAFQSGNEKLFYGLLCRAAAANLVEAELRLGAVHLMDTGFVKQNHKYARYWLERAAAKGNIKASYALATLYLRGKGGPVKGQRGVELMTRAANAGEPLAMIELVQVYAEGKFVVQSIDTAKYWARQAKLAGHPTGQKLLDILETAPPTMRR